MKLVRLSVSSFAAGLWLLAIGAPSVRADATADARHEIQQSINRTGIAFKRKNLKAYFAIFAPGFYFIDMQGARFDLETMRRSMTQILSAAKTVNGDSTIQRFNLKGSQAVVVGREAAIITLTKPNSKKFSKLSFQRVTKNTWAKSRRGWLLKRVRELSAKYTLDGKVLKPPARKRTA